MASQWEVTISEDHDLGRSRSRQPRGRGRQDGSSDAAVLHAELYSCTLLHTAQFCSGSTCVGADGCCEQRASTGLHSPDRERWGARSSKRIEGSIRERRGLALGEVGTRHAGPPDTAGHGASSFGDALCLYRRGTACGVGRALRVVLYTRPRVTCRSTTVAEMQM